MTLHNAEPLLRCVEERLPLLVEFTRLVLIGWGAPFEEGFRGYVELVDGMSEGGGEGWDAHEEDEIVDVADAGAAEDHGGAKACVNSCADTAKSRPPRRVPCQSYGTSSVHGSNTRTSVLAGPYQLAPGSPGARAVSRCLCCQIARAW